MVQEASTQAAFRDHKEWFATFLRHCDQKSVQRSATLQGLQDEFPVVWQRVRNPEYTFDTVFVGAGNGGLEIPLMQDFTAARGTSRNLMVFCEDPSPQMKEGFYVAAKSAGVDSQLKDYSVLPFDDSLYVPPQADFALASHVWYYIKHWQDTVDSNNTLLKFANMLKPGGAGLITLYSNSSDRYSLRSGFAAVTGVEVELPGEDVAAELQKLGIKHQVSTVDSHTDISSCFQKGIFNPDAEGKMLLSFILRAPWDDQSPTLQEHIKANIVSLVNKNGREELVFRDCYIWLSNP